MKAILVKVMLTAGLATTVALNYNRSEQDASINDKDIHYISYEEMNYPPLAHQERIGGVTVIRLKLDDHGKVVEASAISGQEVLIASAIANAKKWQFEPNRQHAVIMVYNFRLARELCNSSFFTFQPPNFVTITACPMDVQP